MTQHAESTEICPLCKSFSTSLWCTDSQARLNHREYWQCQNCELVFVPPQFHLSHDDEKAIYDLHENHIDDPGYQRYLQPAFNAVTSSLPQQSIGLDFGAGPGPALATMLTAASYKTSLYDAYYHRNNDVWQHTYDFITCTEVFEHLSQPHDVIQQLHSHLKPNGVLVVMTMFWQQQKEFMQWSYKNDPTHICFYTPKTFHWIVNHWGYELVQTTHNLAVMRKRAPS
ncbi:MULTISPECIES: class I SAM-dependent methyltransferase [Gammaproteobacteria]|uniref:class I SAM-dependent methyltransferase n=1 Tax=Gammaproteobacteria TaxID=1236 RepID=UPI000DD0B9B3|nr:MULTISPECIES: class I SAM-dependent methyltransferase [Gammaproteobacteria]RTE85948.1 class I SAM-dependent methyltransferase [Aliidiomarina sp. B3213]TCZ90053.1 class I SAM-dependent methyltransferase [Lysobacter sp. N42]